MSCYINMYQYGGFLIPVNCTMSIAAVSYAVHSAQLWQWVHYYLYYTKKHNSAVVEEQTYTSNFTPTRRGFITLKCSKIVLYLMH